MSKGENVIDRMKAIIGLLDVLNGMQSGPRGERTPAPAGKSPIGKYPVAPPVVTKG